MGVAPCKTGPRDTGPAGMLLLQPFALPFSILYPLHLSDFKYPRTCIEPPRCTLYATVARTTYHPPHVTHIRVCNVNEGHSGTRRHDGRHASSMRLVRQFQSKYDGVWRTHIINNRPQKDGHKCAEFHNPQKHCVMCAALVTRCNLCTYASHKMQPVMYASEQLCENPTMTGCINCLGTFERTASIPQS